jgi:hypothetical protein
MSLHTILPADDIAPVFDTIRKNGAEAVYVVGDALMNSNRGLLSRLAVGARLPTICVGREYVEAGGLISYGANIPHQFRRATPPRWVDPRPDCLRRGAAVFNLHISLDGSGA